MKKFLVAACCASLLCGVTVASAQTSGPPSQQTVTTNSPMDSNARMMKKKKMKKGSMKSGGGMSSDSMQGGGMQGGGMQGGGMQGGGMSR